MKRRLIPLFCLLLSLGAAEFSDSDRQAALEYLKASGVPQTLKRSFDALLEAQFRMAPELEKIRPELTKFFAETYSFQAFQQELTGLYLKHYTPGELRQLTAFYRTPLGRKKAEVDGAVAPEISALIQQQTRRRLPELQKAVQKWMQQKGKKK